METFFFIISHCELWLVSSAISCGLIMMWLRALLSFHDIRVSLVLIGGSAAVSVSLYRVCYDAFCTMTSYGRRWSIKHWIHRAVYHISITTVYSCCCSLSSVYLKCMIVKNRDKDIYLYFDNKDWVWVNIRGKGWVMKRLTLRSNNAALSPPGGSKLHSFSMIVYSRGIQSLRLWAFPQTTPPFSPNNITWSWLYNMILLFDPMA